MSKIITGCGGGSCDLGNGCIDLCISSFELLQRVAKFMSSGNTTVDFRPPFRQTTSDDRDGTKGEYKRFGDGI